MTRHSGRLWAGVTAVLFVLFLPAAALAHAELGTMMPADKSTVPAPSEIVATFTENLDQSGSSLALVNASGNVVAKGGSVSTTNPKQMTLDLSSQPLDEESYTIRWTSKSAADGDLDRGTTTFTVIAGPSLPIGSSEPASPSPSLVASPSAIDSTTPSPSGAGGTSASSTNDALIPIIVALIVLAALGLWLMRSRAGVR